MRAGWEVSADGGVPAEMGRKGSGLLQRKPPKYEIHPGWVHFFLGQSPWASGQGCLLQPRSVVRPGERRRFCPKPPSQPLSLPWMWGKQILVPSEYAVFFSFSIPFLSCAPSGMSKVAHKQAGMAPVGVLGVVFVVLFFSKGIFPNTCC